jgi:hypothetical protein
VIIPFIGPAYQTQSRPWACQDSLNLYLEVGGSGSKTSAALLSTPGLVEFATLNEAGGETRGLWASSDGNLYAVCGNKLSKVTPSGVVTSLGTLDTTSGPVSMGDNGVQVFMADNPNGYTYTLASNAFAKITDADWPGAAQVDYLDGYMLGITPNSGQFWVTDLYDAGSMSALDFASAEGNPDKLVAIQVDHREVWLFGERTTEVWYNSGDSSFPLSRVGGAFLELGCAARFSVARGDNTQFWLSTDGTVVRADGYTPKIISTRAIEAAIAGYARVDDARGFYYSQAGHGFYVLTFPSEDVTWVYDAAVDAWHRRASWGMGRWRPTCHARLGQAHIVGDGTSGRLYRIDPAAATDAGQPIERMRVTAPLVSEDKRLIHSRVCIDFETGVGTLSGQGQDPQALLSWSDDGGRTWSQEHAASLGRQGAYRTRAEWRRLGQSRSRVYRVRVTDPVRVSILAAYGDVAEGRP